MSISNDLRVLSHLVLRRGSGETHAERLRDFYSGQADAYDDFRARLLQGRRELWAALPAPEGGVWVDMGGGTGWNFELLGDRVGRLDKIYVVDLCGPLLEVARRRAEARGWTNLETVEADVTDFVPPEGGADVVTFSYSLTMIPDWFAAIDQAARLLKPGGRIGVVDFFVSRKHPPEGWTRHGWWTRTFWPAWFAFDNVHLDPGHGPYLARRFATEHRSEHRARVPYLAGLKVPIYLYIGRPVSG